jgi:hypothetical protein
LNVDEAVKSRFLGILFLTTKGHEVENIRNLYLSSCFFVSFVVNFILLRCHQRSLFDVHYLFRHGDGPAAIEWVLKNTDPMWLAPVVKDGV